MRVVTVVAVVIILSAACSHPDRQPPASSTPLPAAASTLGSGSAPATKAAPAAAMWWCTASPDGAANWCGQDRKACETMRQTFAQHGYQVNDCASQTSAFCFTSTGEITARCAGNLIVCREQYDRIIANPSHGTATSRCREESVSGQVIVGAAPRNAPPPWWCMVEADDVMEVCTRQLSTCQIYREGMSGKGHKMGECAGRASAFCFATRPRSGSRFGLAHLQCAIQLSACRGIRDILLGGVDKTEGIDVLSDCAEQH